MNTPNDFIIYTDEDGVQWMNGSRVLNIIPIPEKTNIVETDARTPQFLIVIGNKINEDLKTGRI